MPVKCIRPTLRPMTAPAAASQNHLRAAAATPNPSPAQAIESTRDAIVPAGS